MTRLTIFTILFVLLCHGLVNGKQCVICNSYLDGPSCLNWDEKSFVKDCSTDTRIDQSKPIKCSSTFMEFAGTERVDRGCTNVEKEECVTSYGTKDVRVEYCICNGIVCKTE